MTTTIYSIYCKDEKIVEFYIGSTKNFAHRKREHVNCCTNEKRSTYNYRLYKFIRENGGFDNWDFKILNQTDYHDTKMKLRQEQCYIDIMRPELNERPAYVSREERDNKRKKHNKMWCQANKEYLSKKKRERRALAQIKKD